MLSYRHGYHVGNHADVIKHLVLVAVLTYLTSKDKAISYVDTHGGAGAYALDQGFALQNAEFATGILPLWQRFVVGDNGGMSPQIGAEAPPLIADYLRVIARANEGSELTRYPGSPRLAQMLLRPQDRLIVYERHPKELTALAAQLCGSPSPQIENADGFGALKRHWPPPSRRGVALIDPSYEIDSDYAALKTALDEAFARFVSGVVLVWVPELPKRQAKQLPEMLRKLASRYALPWCELRLKLAEPPTGRWGLSGSRLFVFNPPWTLAGELAATASVLMATLTPAMICSLDKSDG